MNKIIIVGSGGFGKEILFLVNRITDYDVLGFVDDMQFGSISSIHEVPLLGPTSYLSNCEEEIAVAIGIANPMVRKKFYEILRKNPYLSFPTLVDPSAILGTNISYGDGNIIMCNTTFTSDIKIGDFNMINIGSTIGHDSIIGSYNSIYPNVNISGNVIISNFSEVGVGSQVIQNLKIDNHVVIGAGSVVIRDLPDDSKVAGVPAKSIKKDD